MEQQVKEVSEFDRLIDSTANFLKAIFPQGRSVVTIIKEKIEERKKEIPCKITEVHEEKVQ